ncbi:hypothetical protein [Gordoniibacillus kamchatkensis]|uniref:hypothetical protein n=1 Tax=Gordoniibacillus kamchatkensis TaxID=1590651 RepID=UPI000696C319|nr:hypothetical protein [Paenibacillus sp. VKM B-2647]
MPSKPLLTTPIRYRNVPYAFEITFPRWWEPYTVVDRLRSRHEAETTVSFRFRYRGRIYDPIMTVVIEPISEKEWRAAHKESPLVWLGERDGRSYAYVLAEELPEAFLRPDKLDYDYRRFGRQIRLLKAMVAQAPLVMQSFRFLAPGHS